MRASTILATTVLLAASPAFAAKKAGVTMPDQATVAGKTLVLNGLGVREATMLNVEVYVAGLYVEHKSSDPSALLSEKETKRLVLKFVRDVDRDDLTDAFEEGFEKSGAKGLDAKLKQLNGWMTDMKVGEEMSLTYVPDSGVEVSVRGAKKGVIAGADFARVLFGIWLGASPPNKSLKTGLLGG